MINLLLLVTTQAFAFTGEVHKAVSKQALDAKSYDDAAAADVIRGNLLTDNDEFWATEAHFDDENFAAGSQRLRKKIVASLEAIDACDVAQAREQLGRAMHPTQDFFAHTNWVENHEPSEWADLLDLKDPGAGVVCEPLTHKGPLTSGYYYDDRKHPDSPTPAPAGKCLHSVLNKDDDTRPLYAEARARALAESKELLVRIDLLITAIYAPLGGDEVVYRLRLLKDGSDGFAAERGKCKPNPRALAARPQTITPGLGIPTW